MSSLFIPFYCSGYTFIFSFVSKLLSLPASGEAEGGKEKVIERNLMSSYVGVPWGGLCLRYRCGWPSVGLCLSGGTSLLFNAFFYYYSLPFRFSSYSSSIPPFFCGHSFLTLVARAEKWMSTVTIISLSSYIGVV